MPTGADNEDEDYDSDAVEESSEEGSSSGSGGSSSSATSTPRRKGDGKPKAQAESGRLDVEGVQEDEIEEEMLEEEEEMLSADWHQALQPQSLLQQHQEPEQLVQQRVQEEHASKIAEQALVRVQGGRIEQTSQKEAPWQELEHTEIEEQEVDQVEKNVAEARSMLMKPQEAWQDDDDEDGLPMQPARELLSPSAHAHARLTPSPEAVVVDNGRRQEDEEQLAQAATKLQAAARGRAGRRKTETLRAARGAKQLQKQRERQESQQQQQQPERSPTAPTTQKPPGSRGRTRCRSAGPPVDPLSPEELKRRAQQTLDRTMDRMVRDMASARGGAHQPGEPLPKLKLEDLPPSAQVPFLRVARSTAEVLVKEERKKRPFVPKPAPQTPEQAQRLADWYEKKFQEDLDRQQQEATEKREQMERERASEEQRRKRQKELQKKLSEWARSKDTKEKESAAAAKSAAKAERDRMQRIAQTQSARRQLALTAWRKDQRELMEANAKAAEERRLREQQEKEELKKEEAERAARLRQVAKVGRRHVLPPPGSDFYVEQPFQSSLTPRAHHRR